MVECYECLGKKVCTTCYGKGEIPDAEARECPAVTGLVSAMLVIILVGLPLSGYRLYLSWGGADAWVWGFRVSLLTALLFVCAALAVRWNVAWRHEVKGRIGR